MTTISAVLTEPHPYQLGMRSGRWERYGCEHCNEKPGAEIHNPERWDVTYERD